MSRIKALAGRVFGSRAGESIAETLAALLICTLAVLMLFTAVSSAVRMNALADQSTEATLQASREAETGASDASDRREVTVDGFDERYEVEYYDGGSGGVISYRYVQDQGGWTV